MKRFIGILAALAATVSLLSLAACSNSAGGSTGGATITTPSAPTTQTDGGASAPETYTITISTSIQNGSVAASKTSAAAGDTVTLTFAPSEDYEFGSWLISAADGTALPVKNKTFVMPAQNVTVYAKFVSVALRADFVKVEGGTVVGGNKFNGGVFVAGRSVAISTFWICDHEVTQAEYQAVMGTNPSHFDGLSGKEAAAGETQEKRPVEKVSWYDAITYCNKKSLAEGLTPCYTVSGVDFSGSVTVPTTRDDTWNAATCDFTNNGYRLPTEAEWEYAARGGRAGCEAASPTDWAGTDSEAELGKYAWYDSNSNSKTHEVKTEKQAGVNSANSLGLYDMSGNVWEWCWDRNSSSATINDDAYKVGGVVTNPAGAKSGSSRVYRGGSWNLDANYCSVAMRNGNSPYVRMSNFVGFRVVRTAN